LADGEVLDALNWRSQIGISNCFEDFPPQRQLRYYSDANPFASQEE